MGDTGMKISYSLNWVCIDCWDYRTNFTGPGLPLTSRLPMKCIVCGETKKSVLMDDEMIEKIREKQNAR